MLKIPFPVALAKFTAPVAPCSIASFVTAPVISMPFFTPFLPNSKPLLAPSLPSSKLLFAPLLAALPVALKPL